MSITNLLHLLGFVLLFGGLTATALIRASKSAPRTSLLNVSRVCYVAGMLVLIVSGFKMASHMSALANELPLWVKGKLAVVILFIVGAIIADRPTAKPRILIPYFVVLGIAGTLLAAFKPH